MNEKEIREAILKSPEKAEPDVIKMAQELNEYDSTNENYSIGFYYGCKYAFSQSREEIERLEEKKDRVVGELIKWKELACNRLNHEILPMKAEIEELSSTQALLDEAMEIIDRIVNGLELDIYERGKEFLAKIEEETGE